MSEQVLSAARVLDLLEYFATKDDGATLTDVVAAFQLPKSSTLALLRTLCLRRYLERDERGIYSMNDVFRTHGFGWAGGQLVRLLSMAGPILQDAVEQGGETICLGILTDDGKVKILARALSPQSVRYEVDVGRVAPVHCTAMGRALLGGLSMKERNLILAKHPLDAYTPQTLTKPEQIHAEMDRIREDKFCVVSDEHDMGGTGIAMAIHDDRGRPVAAVNFACITARFESKKKAMLVTILSNVVKELETAFPN